MMRRIVLEKDTVALPAALPISPEQTYVLQLRPIVFADADHSTDPEDAYPFHIMGIVCELIDVTDLKQMHQLKIQLIERIYLQVRNDLGSLIQDMSLIDRETSVDPQRQKVMTVLKNITTNFLSVLDKSFSFLNLDVAKRDTDVYPISIKDIIEICLNTYQHDEQFKNVSFQTRIPNMSSLGFASPIEMKYAIRAMIDFLIEDSIENSEVVIIVEERDDHIVCRFSNSGFGMPIERLQDYLAGGGDVNSEKFARLRQTVEYVRNWGGTFEACSEIGVGVRFQLKLKGFM